MKTSNQSIRSKFSTDVGKLLGHCDVKMESSFGLYGNNEFKNSLVFPVFNHSELMHRSVIINNPMNGVGYVYVLSAVVFRKSDRIIPPVNCERKDFFNNIPGYYSFSCIMGVQSAMWYVCKDAMPYRGSINTEHLFEFGRDSACYKDDSSECILESMNKVFENMATQIEKFIV